MPIFLNIVSKYDKKGQQSAENALKSFTKVAAASAAAVAAVGVAWVAASAKQLMEIEKLNAQTNAAILSTGGAAGRSIEQINGLNASLEKLTGIEAEVIQEGQNMLLTFTNINGKTFDEATVAALDLSVALGKDMQSSALLVGKALNDPIAGLGALSKAGVQFTDDQRAMITGMVEFGDTAGAQAIILGELNTQFGGSAEAFGETTAGKLAKVQHLFGEMGENIAASLLPALERFADFATEFMATHGPGLEKALSGIADFIVGMIDGFIGFTEWWAANSKIMNAVATAIGIIAAVVLVAAAAIAVMNAVMYANPIVLIIMAIVAAIAGVVVAIVLLVTYWDEIMAAMAMAWEWFVGIIVGAWEAVVGFFTGAFTNIGKMFEAVWTGVGNFFKGIINGLIGMFEGFINFFIDGINGLIGPLNTLLDGIAIATGGAIDLNIPTLSKVSIPRLAEGGVVMPSPGGSIVNVAEGGQAEAIIPLDRFGGFGGGTTNNYNINVTAGVGDPAAIGQQIVTYIKKFERSGGPVFASA
jgi:hypothetical protein